MANFFQKLHAKIGKTNKFPQISWGHRFEGIEYETANNSIFIDSTFDGGRRIYTDSIRTWKDDEPISQPDKVIIFKNVLAFANRKGKGKPTIVINVDDDKGFWEALCAENSGLIEEIQYESNKQKSDFQLNYLLDSLRNNGTIIFGDKRIKTEAELLEYWENRNNV